MNVIALLIKETSCHYRERLVLGVVVAKLQQSGEHSEEQFSGMLLNEKIPPKLSSASYFLVPKL